MNTRKYYVMVPTDFSFSGEPYWAELLDVKTLTAAKHYVERVFGGLPQPEIGMSVNGGNKTVIAKKNSKENGMLCMGTNHTTAAPTTTTRLNITYTASWSQKKTFSSMVFNRKSRRERATNLLNTKKRQTKWLTYKNSPKKI